MKLLHNTILFVDDDPDDLEFYGESMRAEAPDLVIVEARSGLKALEYLEWAKREGRLPCLIVLDVNMPQMSGRDTLFAIRKDESYNPIPVVIFSTASHPNEKAFFEDCEVEFLTKPCSAAEMQEVSKRLMRYCPNVHAGGSR